MKKNIPFKQFIKAYNFRRINDSITAGIKEDTEIIRIYPAEYDANNWFELGVNDFSRTWEKMDILEQVLSKEILNSYVETISYLEGIQSTVTIYLTKEKESEE